MRPRLLRCALLHAAVRALAPTRRQLLHTGESGLFAAPTRRQLLAGGAAGLIAAPLRVDAAPAIPTWDLGNGARMPTLALNTVGLDAASTERAVLAALETGIGHVDFHPDKERDGVAAALKRVPRSSLFLTTKVRSQQNDPSVTPAKAADLARKQLEEDRSILGVDTVDMWLLRDSPNCDVMRAQWAVLEEARDAGKVGSIGLVNYCEKQLSCLLETARITPAVNYYYLHVGQGPDAGGLRSFGEKRGVRTFAYGACGEPGPSASLLSSDAVQRAATAHGVAPEAVCVRWLTQNGAAVSARPTLEFALGASACKGDGTCAAGLKSRAESFGFTLSRAEMAALDAVDADAQPGALFSRACNPDLFTGNARDPLRRS